MKEAPVNPTAKIDHYLLASVFRNVTEGHITMKRHKEKVNEEVKVAEKYAQEKYKDLIENIKKFEEKSGVKILQENNLGQYTYYNLHWHYEGCHPEFCVKIRSSSFPH